MTTPITSDELAALAVAVDGAAEARGWNQPHLLVRVQAGDEPDGVQLGFKEIEGHPTEWLLGFTAPDEWAAVGLCCEGWMAPIDSGTRPSQSKGRQRIRHTIIVSRDGPYVTGVHKAGGEYEPMPADGVGTTIDLLRRALRLPTDPPDAPVTQLLASMLLQQVVDLREHKGLRVGRTEIQRATCEFEVLAQMTWTNVHNAIRHSKAPVLGLTPDVAEWMDEGMVSRWLLGSLPPYEVLLDVAAGSTSPRAFAELRGLLRRWGLRTRARAA